MHNSGEFTPRERGVLFLEIGATSSRGAQATKQSTLTFAERWIASRSLSSGAHSRDPLARNHARGLTSCLKTESEIATIHRFSRRPYPSRGPPGEGEGDH